MIVLLTYEYYYCLILVVMCLELVWNWFGTYLKVFGICFSYLSWNASDRVLNLLGTLLERYYELLVHCDKCFLYNRSLFITHPPLIILPLPLFVSILAKWIVLKKSKARRENSRHLNRISQCFSSPQPVPYNPTSWNFLIFHFLYPS